MTMQEEQIREALNKHWQESATGDANAEHDIYEEVPFVIISPVNEFSGEAISRKGHHRANRRASTSSGFRKVTSGSGIPHIPGA
jgi:hypothetical protein